MINIEELKKLPTHVKVDLIDELVHSINNNEDDETDADADIIKEMEHRLDDMESGKDEGYTWEEAKAILMEDMNKRKLQHG